jgi:hypothetical protein
VKISLCHIWLGVERSKNRGWGGLRRGFFRLFGISPSRCSVRRTVSGLAGRNSTRLNHWEIRRMPNVGCDRLTSVILA